MSIQVKEFAFVLHPVNDVDRARKFYEGLLGLKASKELEFAPGQWWIEYDVAGQALAISNGMPAAPSTALTLEVADLDEAVIAVKEAGVTIAFETMEFPGCRVFWIRDADGNQIGLHQRKAGV